MILLDLFCGRWGWSRAFAKRGWKCIGVDTAEPPETPVGCEFLKADVLLLEWNWLKYGYSPDAIVASSPCEEFSVHGMKHFHPNPKYPENGIRLFNHTRQLCEASGVPYVMENVRAAQPFVGNAVHHCGPFYLWGNAAPPILNQGITKKQSFRMMPGNERIKVLKAGLPLKTYRNKYQQIKEREAMGLTGTRNTWSSSEARKEARALVAQIPPELANCVAEYFERILEKQEMSA